MEISQLTREMIRIAQGNLHDINYFLKVYAYARTIGLEEKIPEMIQTTLEAASLVHDIACPLCREKYGSTNGKYQELEGGPMARELLRSLGASSELTERVGYLVEHHHTPSAADGPDYQILLEADYLVNADESPFSRESIENARSVLFKTKTGIALLDALYLKPGMT